MPNVAIILATYNPNLDFFREQLDSIIGQSLTDWFCVITDDSDEEYAVQIQKMISVDPRFSYLVNSNTKGSIFNFENGLAHLAAQPELIALCDQDDIWEKEKLEKVVQYFSNPEVMLVHHDLSLIDSSGKFIAPSCWAIEKRELLTHPKDLIFRNCITGCASVFRSEVLGLALPFFPQSHPYFYHHDQWIALAASIKGTIIADPACWVRYRQHGRNVVGAYLEERTSLAQKLQKLREFRRKSLFAYQSRLRLSQDFSDRIPDEDLKREIRNTFSHFGNLCSYLVTRAFRNRIWMGIAIQLIAGYWFQKTRKKSEVVGSSRT